MEPIVLAGLISLIAVLAAALIAGLARQRNNNNKKAGATNPECPFGLGNPSLALSPIHDALQRIEKQTTDQGSELTKIRMILQERLPRLGEG